MTAPKIDPETVAEMLDGVTPGPWIVSHPEYHIGMRELVGPSLTCRGFTIATDVDAAKARTIEADARFIAWAREAVPALAARVAELEADRIKGQKDYCDLSDRHDAEFVRAEDAEKRVAELEAANRELTMQSLADLGQAQEAYEAQKAAEAKLAARVAELEAARKRDDQHRRDQDHRIRMQREELRYMHVICRGVHMAAASAAGWNKGRAEAAEAKLAASEARVEKLREALEEAVEVVHKAYVAATMEAVNAGPSHPLKDNFDKWRVRCLNAEAAARAALQETEK